MNSTAVSIQKTKPMPSRGKSLSIAKRVGWTALAAIFSLSVLGPFFSILFTAVKTRREVPHNPLGLPQEWHFENFIDAWQQGHFSRYFMNSIYTVIPTVILVLVLSTLAAYAFSRLQFKGKSIFFVLFLIGLAIPLDILIIPLFYELLAMDLLNTPWAIVFPTVAKTLPFGILLVRTFMETLPQEVIDAGRIDGCSSLQILTNIIVPLSKPVLTSLLVFTFMWTWNTFILPIVFIQEDAARTLPVGLNFFQGRYSTNVPLLMAGTLISSIPIILVYLIFQRQFIKGIVAGAFK
jgi:raffinose/stachyose/melibiose transport system permease protein